MDYQETAQIQETAPDVQDFENSDNAESTAPEFAHRATYSPEDNKLRLYPDCRLDKELYSKVRAMGFIWAAKQGLFVAPMWTPARFDFLMSLCGDVEDEDTTLAERADQRADRFDGYQGSRLRDAEAASNAARQLSQGIPFGQPILVGHHSERRARKDAEKIEAGLRRAVQMWETSEYWQRRAAGALAHAKYKELPAVRYRRIKTLEADQRKQQRNQDDAKKWLDLWTQCEAETNPEKQKAQALQIASYCSLSLPRKEGDKPDFNQRPSAYSALTNAYPNLYAPRELQEIIDYAKKAYPKYIAFAQRWIDHYQMRIDYERAMLNEQGGIVADQYDIQPGGRVLVRNEWLTVIRVNKRDGKINSVTTSCRWVAVRTMEEIKGYEPPTQEDAEKVKKATKLPPMVNYPEEGFLEMTTEEYKKKHSEYKITKRAAATAEHGAYRYRAAFLAGSGYKIVQVYLTDAKRVDKPAPSNDAPVKFETRRAVPEQPQPEIIQKPEPQGLAADIAGMKAQLKEGIKVVSAPQLFPTPRNIAQQMADYAEIDAGMRVLEPSAGTGRLLEAIPSGCDVVAVEINSKLAAQIPAHDKAVIFGDFLECTAETIGTFDRILMNPPFANGQDIAHIKHALTLLNPNGVLVAICCNGPRQNETLRPIVDQFSGTWEKLPEGTFSESGTNVNTALMVIRT